jgi:hypothetical protein
MIRDLDGNGITSASVLVAPDGVYLFSQLIDCKTGYIVTAEYENADVTFEAKIGAGAYVDIVATPLSLTAYAGLRKQVDFRITTSPTADAASFVAEIQVQRA